jgi:hypothetical protein
MKDWYQKPVAEGRFLYDSTVEMPMYLIEQNYDYFYTMYEEDGMLEEGEKPKLNSDGLVYYLFFGELPSKPPYGVSEQGVFMSIAEAKKWAQKELSYFSHWC